MSVSSLGYVRIAMGNPQEWAEVGQDILGFVATTGEDESVRLKMDEAPFRYLVEKGDADGFVCAGWEYPAEQFDDLVRSLETAGINVQHGDDAACSARAVKALISFVDPAGNLVEVFHTRDEADSFESPLGIRYVAGELGLGHCVLPAIEHEATSAFYESSLGFGRCDTLVLPAPAEGAPEMRIHFYHADNPRHHSLALFNGPAPSGAVHLMTEMTSIDDIGACQDRVNAAGLPVITTLGRHINDNMVSFYFLAPGGIPMEVGYDGFQFDWTDFEPTLSTEGDHWGHEYNFPA